MSPFCRVGRDFGCDLFGRDFGAPVDILIGWGGGEVKIVDDLCLIRLQFFSTVFFFSFEMLKIKTILKR